MSRDSILGGLPASVVPILQELGRPARRADMPHRIMDEIRAECPDFMPLGLDLPAFLALVPRDGALVALLVTDWGAFIAAGAV